MDDLTKAHINGHTRKDGVYVRPHERGNTTHHVDVVVHHPKPNHKGEPVVVKNPSRASHASTWHNPDSVASFVPDGDSPISLNGVELAPWLDHPKTDEGWDFVDGVDDNLDEPPFHVPVGFAASSGVVIQEPDGRVWVISPTNQFGGYNNTFPKGTAEDGLSLQANAIKETFEETGLKVHITGFLGDYKRSTSVARMYTAKRVGGIPTDMGWETQAVHLMPKGHLYDHLNGSADHPIVEAIGGGIAPKPKPKNKNFPLF